MIIIDPDILDKAIELGLDQIDGNQVYKVEKVSHKNKGNLPDIFEKTGTIMIIDRGGGPSILVGGNRLVTSWVLKCTKNEDDSFDIETENSHYRLSKSLT